MMKNLLPSISRTAYPLLAACGLLSTTGCLTYDTRSARVTQEREDTLIIQEDMRRLNGQLEGLQMELDRLQREIDSLRSEQSNTLDLELRSLRDDLQSASTRINQVEAARERDKQEIVDKLSTKMAELMKTAQASTPTRTRKARSGYYYEHEVQPGQTLSEIAAAYGVSTKVIIDENEIKDPNTLKVGQILYVPE